MSDGEGKPKITFKKKNVKGKARGRTRADEDFSGVSLFSTTKRTAERKVDASRWTKYSALGETDDRAGEERVVEEEVKTLTLNSLHDEVPLPAGLDVPDGAIVVDEVAVDTTDEASTSNAYTTLDVPAPAKTFSLRESHFRELDSPLLTLDREYADRFGNVDDEEEKPKSDGDDDIYDDVVDDNEYEKMPFSILDARADLRDDLYDMELSVSDDEATTAHKIPTHADVVEELTQKLAELDSVIQMRHAKMTKLQADLDATEAKKQELIAQL